MAKSDSYVTAQSVDAIRGRILSLPQGAVTAKL